MERRHTMKRGFMILPNGQVVSGSAPKNMKNADRYARAKMGKRIDATKKLMRENKRQEQLSSDVVEMLSK